MHMGVGNERGKGRGFSSRSYGTINHVKRADFSLQSRKPYRRPESPAQWQQGRLIKMKDFFRKRVCPGLRLMY